MSADRAEDGLEKYRHELRMKSRRLHGDSREPPAAEMHRVARWVEEHELEADAYGDGEHLQAFEQRVADRLGFPSARFMPSGTMAQQIAVRVWVDRASNDVEADKNVGMHPTCHLEIHEELGYRHLHGLRSVPVGVPDRPIVAADLDRLPEPISALIVELPARELGGLLAPFDELVAIREVAKQRDIALHMDGARLWEAAAGYGRPLDEIAQLFDSVYVSFYKGIGALPGSMLLGPEDFVAEAGIWQVRHGGRLYTQLANWTSAAMRLDRQLAKMPAYFERAKEIARSLRDIPGIEISPQIPHVNMFQVTVTGDLETLLQARDRAAEHHDVWLFGEPRPTDADTFMFEVAVGDAAMELLDEEIRAAFTTLAGGVSDAADLQ